MPGTAVMLTVVGPPVVKLVVTIVLPENDRGMFNVAPPMPKKPIGLASVPAVLVMVSVPELISRALTPPPEVMVLALSVAPLLTLTVPVIVVKRQPLVCAKS